MSAPSSRMLTAMSLQMKTLLHVAACAVLTSVAGCSNSSNARAVHETDAGDLDPATGPGGSHGGTGGGTGTGGATSNRNPGPDAASGGGRDAGTDAMVSPEGGSLGEDGGSFTPEGILAVPEVKAALAAAEAAGYPIATHTERKPPAI